MFISDVLTISRIIITPFFIGCFYTTNLIFYQIGVALFVILSITDIADGYIARKFKRTSKFGVVMDPAADKILSLSALLMLVNLNSITTNSIIFVYIILIREILIMSIRVLYESFQDSLRISKIKTAVLNLSIFIFLIDLILSEQNDMIFFTAEVLLGIAAALSVYSIIKFILMLNKK